MKELKSLVFTLEIEPDLADAAVRLGGLLGFTVGEGIVVRAEQGERDGVVLKNGVATIYY